MLSVCRDGGEWDHQDSNLRKIATSQAFSADNISKFTNVQHDHSSQSAVFSFVSTIHILPDYLPVCLPFVHLFYPLNAIAPPLFLYLDLLLHCRFKVITWTESLSGSSLDQSSYGASVRYPLKTKRRRSDVSVGERSVTCFDGVMLG